ncbi:hypothetical protein ACHQM5_014184 [Ranunculus cassubicifolius]
MAASHQFNIFSHMISASTTSFLPNDKIPLQPLGKVASKTLHSLCYAASVTWGASDEMVVRRSANYKPCTWDYDFLTSLDNGYQGHAYLRLAEILKQKVANQLQRAEKKSAIALLELVNEIQRLGIGHLFEENIKSALNSIQKVKLDDNLQATSLRFRILRQHGFKVSQDVFKIYMDPHGNFANNLSQDIEGVLSLYEASFLSVGGEVILDEARLFAHRLLKDCNGCFNINKLELVKHALEVPLHLNYIRLEARWYIDAYSRREDVDLDLLELARLDYNIVQAIHQKDIIDLLRWWKNLGLLEQLPFARDKLVESFFAPMGVASEPQYSNCRKGLTKVLSFVNTIDDVYDVYATLDEAKLFTDAVARWDMNSLDNLPNYMKICLIGLNNTTYEIVYHILKDKGLNVMPFLKKMWLDQCKAYLVEAEWFHNGYKPTLKEYLNNGWISIGGANLLLNIYVLMSPTITLEALHYLVSCPELVRSLSMLLRLIDDMGTYQNETLRGDVPKSVQCYMNDKGVTEEVASKYIRHLIEEEWKKLNSELWTESPLPEVFIKEVVNLARVTKSTYQYGDPCCQDQMTDKILSLLVDSIPMSF